VTLKFWAIFLVCLLLPCAARSSSGDLASAQRKIAHIEANARAAHPDPRPTVLTESEVNAYIASDNVKLPAGVESVKLIGESGMISGTAHIDFDKVREGTHSSNPLLSMFSGVHEVLVVTHAHGENAQGYVHVDSVSLDGVEVPHFVLQLFVEKFLQPKYPQIGLDSQFTLPNRIDSAAVGEHQLTLIQK